MATIWHHREKTEASPCITTTSYMRNGSEDRIESNLSKTKNTPPKAVIFSDFCCIFAL